MFISFVISLEGTDQTGPEERDFQKEGRAFRDRNILDKKTSPDFSFADHLAPYGVYIWDSNSNMRIGQTKKIIMILKAKLPSE